MAALRKHVFVEKVLKRLFADAPRGQQQRPLPTAPSVDAPEAAGPGAEVRAPGAPWQQTGGGATPRPGACAAGDPSPALTGRRPYTVSLPPEGYLPGPPAPGPGPPSPSSSASSSTEEDQDPHDPPKRRRIRRHKSKKKFKDPSNVHVEQAELESLLQEKLQPQYTGGPTMSKNKKRKLKKKQQIKRKTAAGLLAKPAPAMDFMYQPEGGREPAAEAGTAGVGAGAAGEGPGAAGEGPGAAGEGAAAAAQSILSFLRATQEAYFYAGDSADTDLAVSMETAERLFWHLETRGLVPSDLLLLDHMQTLLLSGDAAGLRGALEAFPERCALPPDHARVISALFSYWITHVLPEKKQ